mgnify:CR=1 FL=1
MSLSKPIDEWEFPKDYSENKELIYTLYTDIYSQLGCEDHETKDDMDVQCACIIFDILCHELVSYAEWTTLMINDGVNYIEDLNSTQMEIICYLLTTIVSINLENKVGLGIIKWDK